MTHHTSWPCGSKETSDDPTSRELFRSWEQTETLQMLFIDEYSQLWEVQQWQHLCCSAQSHPAPALFPRAGAAPRNAAQPPVSSRPLAGLKHHILCTPDEGENKHARYKTLAVMKAPFETLQTV